MLENLVTFLNEHLGCSIEVPVDTEDITDVTETQDENTIVYPMCRKTPSFSYGDIRHVHRIYASN